jgi:hypothetical protein
VTISCETTAVCGNGIVEGGEQCDLGSANGQLGSCCTAACQFAPSDTVCRPAAGECDQAETCTGSSATCPADQFKPSGTVCRPAAGECDQAETCTGSSATCPADQFKPSGTVCRPAAGECDQAETCTGSSATCPADQFKPSGTSCTDDGNECTLDVCNGSGTCTHPNKSDGTSCTDDGKTCTDDVCQSGTCTHPIKSGNCLINGTCYTEGQNNPANECQACIPGTSQTGFSNKPNNTPCTDDGKACTDDVCQSGTCTHPNKPAGTACDPKDGCPALEQCTGSDPECPRPDADQDGTRDKCDFCPTTPTGACQNLVTVSAATFSLTQTAATSKGTDTAQAANDKGLLVADFASNQLVVYLGNGDGTFRRIRTYMTGDGPIAIGIGDFNGDGKTDWVTANNLSSTLTVGLGRGDGTFDRIFTVFLIGGVNPTSLAVADFDRDGRLDVAVTNFTSNNVTILLGRGDGRFVEAFNIPLFGSGPSAIVAADLNLDGAVDLAVAHVLSNEVSLLPGNGEGWFVEARRIPVREGPVALTTADFNRDGRPDLAVANFTADAISLLLSRTKPLDFTRTDVSAGQNPIALVTGEFIPETLGVAAANFTSGDISLVSTGSGPPFRRVSQVRALSNPTSLTVGDFNNDGRLDIAIVGSPFGQLLTLLGAGDGTFVLKR